MGPQAPNRVVSRSRDQQSMQACGSPDRLAVRAVCTWLIACARSWSVVTGLPSFRVTFGSVFGFGDRLRDKGMGRVDDGALELSAGQPADVPEHDEGLGAQAHRQPGAQLPVPAGGEAEPQRGDGKIGPLRKPSARAAP